MTPDGAAIPVRVRSMVGMIPALAAAVVNEDDLRLALVVGKRFAGLLGRDGLAGLGALREQGMLRGRLPVARVTSAAGDAVIPEPGVDR